MFNNHSLNLVNILGTVLEKTQVDKIGNFAWSAVDFQTYKRFGAPSELASIAIDSFVNSIKGIEFSLVILEYEKNKINVSFRSSSEINVGELAHQLGGGGHHKAAAARLEGNYQETVDKIVSTARTFNKRSI